VATSAPTAFADYDNFNSFVKGLLAYPKESERCFLRRQTQDQTKLQACSWGLEDKQALTFVVDGLGVTTGLAAISMDPLATNNLIPIPAPAVREARPGAPIA
jgi:hypothetical protein